MLFVAVVNATSISYKQLTRKEKDISLISCENKQDSTLFQDAKAVCVLFVATVHLEAEASIVRK